MQHSAEFSLNMAHHIAQHDMPVKLYERSNCRFMQTTCVVIFGGLTTVRSSCDLHVLQHQKDVAMLGVRAVKLDNVVIKG